MISSKAAPEFVFLYANMPNAIRRRNFQEKQAERLSLFSYRYDAVSGNYPNQGIYSKNPQYRVVNKMGSIFSIMKGLDMFVKGFPDQKYAVVFEDDVEFLDGIMPKLENVVEIDREFDVISLCTTNQWEADSLKVDSILVGGVGNWPEKNIDQPGFAPHSPVGVGAPITLLVSKLGAAKLLFKIQTYLLHTETIVGDELLSDLLASDIGRFYTVSFKHRFCPHHNGFAMRTIRD